MPETLPDNPRLLFVVNDPAFFLSHRLIIARAAKEKGFEVHVATPDEDCVSQFPKEGFVFHPLRLVKHGRNPISEMLTCFDLFRLFTTLKPDLVHLVTIKPVLYGGIIARITRVRALVSAVSGLGHMFVDRSLVNFLLRVIVLFGYRIAFNHPRQKVIFQNNDDVELFVEKGLLTPDRVALIKGSGVDMMSFVPSEPATEIPVVLFAGRILWEKGIETLATAAEIVKAQGTRVRFVLVGGRDAWNVSAVPEEQLKAWQRRGVLEWWGHRSSMPEIIANSTLVCLPSLREGLPKTLVEAAASGKAIVATDVPGCREVVRHEVNGLLVPGNDAEALAAALTRLLRDGDLRSSFGRSGRAIAVEEFSEEIVIEKTLRLYTDLLSA